MLDKLTFQWVVGGEGKQISLLVCELDKFYLN